MRCLLISFALLHIVKYIFVHIFHKGNSSKHFKQFEQQTGILKLAFYMYLTPSMDFRTFLIFKTYSTTKKDNLFLVNY